MYLFDLQAKLSQCNDRLRVMTDRRVEVLSEIPSHPLMLNFGERGKRFNSWGKHYMDTTTQKYMEMKENGQAGQYVCGVSSWTPEYDWFEGGVLKARGWRSLALFLVKKGICSIERARRAFNCESLGTTDYDRLEYDQKLRLSQEAK